MKNVILDRALYADVMRVAAECDSFCAVLNCELVKLHENAEMYVCISASGEGEPRRLYVADSRETVARYRGESSETEWIEAIGGAESESICLVCVNAAGTEERVGVSIGAQKPMIPKPLCQTMKRHANAGSRVFVISREKAYNEDERSAFQKRSVLDLSAIDSGGVDILYFDGADRLIEKLLYGGCRELTVFVTETGKAKGITKAIDKISRKAPFSNRITVVVGDRYAPRTATTTLVGSATSLPADAPAHIFFSVYYTEGEGVGVSVGQNTAQWVSEPTDHRLKPHALHYVTSIMSELILRAVSTGEYHAKRLFNVNAKTLVTETIIKED